MAACFDYYAEVGHRSYGISIPPVAAHQINFTIKEPYGVVAAIVPFNFPLLLMAWKVAPALAAGNTLVCKPPHQNPLSNLLDGAVFRRTPAGRHQRDHGRSRHRRGAGPSSAGRPDRVHRLGGGRTADRGPGGQDLKKVNLELGSVDPLIVFDDADLDVAVPGAAWARLLNAGQVCTSAKRMYLAAPIARESPSACSTTWARFAWVTRWIRRWTWAPSFRPRRWPRSSVRSPTAVRQGARVLAGGWAPAREHPRALAHGLGDLTLPRRGQRLRRGRGDPGPAAGHHGVAHAKRARVVEQGLR